MNADSANQADAFRHFLSALIRVHPRLIMVTGFGGTRIVDMLAGEQLPRIC